MRAAVVGGDVRANENMALTATHTLFAREHNRIVDALPATLSAQRRFDIARRVVGAEQQAITYQEFLPAVGVRPGPYRGYDPTVDATLGNEFATVGYRAHSMVQGEIEPSAPAGTYTGEQSRPSRTPESRSRRAKTASSSRSRSTSRSPIRTCSRASASGRSSPRWAPSRSTATTR